MSKKRSLSFFNRKKEQVLTKTQPLYSELAMKIIEKEIELEKSWDVKVIHDLMALYTKVIEYYEQNNNPKYYDFQDRMHKMLIKPQVISALQKVNCPKNDLNVQGSDKDKVGNRPVNKIVISDEGPCEREEAREVPRKVEKIEVGSLVAMDKASSKPPISPSHMDARKAEAEVMRKNLSRELSKTLSRPKNTRKVNVIIERQNSSSRETAHKAILDLSSQDTALERRVASRKMSQLARSMTFTSYNAHDFSQVLPCDLSDMSEENNTSTKSSFFVDEHHLENYEKFEKKLEDIMEKNYSEKATKIAEIKFRYENQMNEISGMGDIMEMLVSQMKLNMQEEINCINAEFDARRKEDIRRLKEENI